MNAKGRFAQGLAQLGHRPGADEGEPLRVALMRYDAKSREFHLLEAVGFPDEVLEGARRQLVFRLGEERGLVGLVGARRQPLYLANTLSDPRWIPYVESLRSAYFVPVLAEGELLGVFMLFSDRTDAFSSTHRALADLFASEIGRILQVAQRIEADAMRGRSDESSAVQVLEQARHMIAFGQAVRDPASDDGETAGLESLSGRELEVVSALQRGLRQSQIARLLNISNHTARNHLKRVYRKLGVHSQVELLATLRSHKSLGARQEPSQTPMRLLYVAHDAREAELVVAALDESAPRIQVTVISPSEARAKLFVEGAPFDALLTDLGPSDSDGLALVLELRARALPLPVVVLTTAGNETITALKAGADDYLTKVEDYLERLPSVLDAALSRFRRETNRAARPLRVLYAEDSPADTEVTCRHLERHAPHITLQCVARGDELLGRLPLRPVEPSQIDVVLLDHRLPDMDALDVLKVLRDERKLDLPVVVVTGYGDAALAVQTLRFGATDYLVKQHGYLYALPASLRGALDRVELARTQRILHESEARFRALFDQAAVGVAQIELEGLRVRTANQRCAEIFGHDAVQMQGLSFSDLTRWDEAGDRTDELEHLARGDLHELRIECRGLRKDGSAIGLRIMLSRMWVPGEASEHLIAVIEDITERRLLRDAQDVLTNELGPLVGNAFVTRAAQSVARVLGVEVGFVCESAASGPSMCVIGLSVDGEPRQRKHHELSDEPWSKLSAGESLAIASDASTLFPACIELLESDVSGLAVVPLTSAFGRPLGALGIASRRPMADPKRAVTVLTLFSLRVAAELERERSQARFNALFEFLPDAVMTVAQDGRIVMANAQAEIMFGYRREELIGSSVERLVPDSARDVHPQMRQAFLTTGAPRTMGGARRNLTAQSKDGTQLSVEIALRPVDFEEGRLVIATVRDVSERLRAEAEREQLSGQLRQAQKMEAVGTLAGGIAHDFNNLLTILSTNVEALQSELDLDRNHPADERLEHVDAAIKRAAALVRRILTFSREAAPVFERLSLRSLVDEATELLRSILPPSVKLTTVFSVGTIVVEGDATQLHQVLVNLCTNAWHALQGKPGEIAIGVDELMLDGSQLPAAVALPKGRYAHLYVRDTGIGMDQATIERVFEPFFTTKPIGQGTGLGLATVHGIVTSHHGAVSVTSEPGAGATFHVYLPTPASIPSSRPRLPRRASSPIPQRPLPEPEPKAPLASRSHILFVDDEAMIVRTASRHFERAGYRITGVTRANDAIAAVSADPNGFDVVFTDLQMPDLSGLELVEELTRLGCHAPVIIASGHVTAELNDRAAALGVAQLMDKPYELRELTEIARRLSKRERG